MDNEPYRDLSHTEACDIIAAHARRNGATVWREACLPSKRIADVLICQSNGDWAIFEVKTQLRASLIDSTQLKYGPFCHVLHVAIIQPPRFDLPLDSSIAGWPRLASRVGIVWVQRSGLTLLRPAKRWRMTEPALLSMIAEFNPYTVDG